MDTPDIAEPDSLAETPDSPDAPWGINPATGRPYTISPEERAARGARLSEARRAKAGAARAPGAEAAPDPAAPGVTPVDRSAQDREPGKGGRPRRARPGRASKAEPKQEAPVPPFRAGPIAKGVNRLYAKAGKIVRLIRPTVGEAILAITRKESDDDVTVGEAWEEVAKVNPRMRRYLLRFVEGGAWG